jgi:hypothetical protein
MSAGTYVALFDYERASFLDEEARSLGRVAPFMPSVISSGIDLALIATRLGQLERARTLLEEVTVAAEAAGAWHGWVWRMRLDELRAELAHRSGDHAAAIEAATSGLDRATRGGRPRYRVWSRCIRGNALAALGHDPNVDLDTALEEARALGEPGLLLHAMRASLEVRPNDTLRGEARALVSQIATAHPDETTRARLLERVGL